MTGREKENYFPLDICFCFYGFLFILLCNVLILPIKPMITNLSCLTETSLLVASAGGLWKGQPLGRGSQGEECLDFNTIQHCPRLEIIRGIFLRDWRSLNLSHPQMDHKNEKGFRTVGK